MTDRDTSNAVPHNAGEAEVPVRRPAARRASWVYAALVLGPLGLMWLVLGSGIFARQDGALGSGGSGGRELGQYVNPFVAVVVVVCACAVGRWLLQRLGQPGVIGEIAAGIALGPSALGVGWPQAYDRLSDARVLTVLAVLAKIGIVLFVFLAGYEVNRSLMRRQGRTALVISHVSIAVPLLLGVLVAIPLHDRFAPDGVGGMPFALFIAASVSVTALPVMIRMLRERDLMGTRIGTLALASALVDDVTAWCLLGLVAALATAGSVSVLPVMLLLTAAFVGVLAFVVPPVLSRVASHRMVAGPTVTAVVILGVLLCALTTDSIGVHPMFGAFLFGLFCPRDIPALDRVRDSLEAPTTAVLLPVFFALSGMRTDLGLLGRDVTLWLWCGFIIVVAIVAKLGGSALAARGLGFDIRSSVRLGALMNCRGLTELVILNVGLELGVISPTLFAMLVLMAVTTTLMTAPLLTATNPRRSAVQRSGVQRLAVQRWARSPGDTGREATVGRSTMEDVAP